MHGGALGDLALTLRLGMQFLREEGARLHVISRVRPGDLSGFRPEILWKSSESVGLHWLYREEGEKPPDALVCAVKGRVVLNALGPKGGKVERRIEGLGPAEIHSFDPRPRDDLRGHILLQWAGDVGLSATIGSEDAWRRSGRTADGMRVGKGTIKKRDSKHEVLEFTDVAARYGGLTRNATGAECRQWETSSGASGGRRIAIHPGSGGVTKCWPIEGYIELARRLRNRAYDVTMLLGPAELERFTTREIHELRLACGRVVESMGADELLGVLRAADLLIGNDAGPSHMAALIGTPTVTIFGPTRAERWGPVSAASIALQCDPVRPAWGLGVEEVLAAAEMALAMGKDGARRGQSLGVEGRRGRVDAYR